MNRESHSLTESPAKHLPRKEREKLLRRREIIEAAKRVFAEKGYRNATLEEIAAAAEFGKGTIYNYFECKEELFIAIMDGTFDEVTELASKAMAISGVSREKFKQLAFNLLLYYKHNLDFFRLLMREVNQFQLEVRKTNVKRIMNRLLRISEILAEALRRDIRAKRVKNHNPSIMATMFLNLIHSFFMRNMQTWQTMSEADLQNAADFITSIFFDGVAVHAH